MTHSLPFTKVESIGNHFVLIEADPDLDYNELAKLTCRHHFGIGADGLLVAGNMGNNHVSLRMFNPDGTEDFCGNGLRCAGWYAYLQGWISSTFTIAHLGRMVPCFVDGDGTISTEIGMATFEPGQVPNLAQAELFRVPASELFRLPNLKGVCSSLSTGSTHLVIEEMGSLDDATFLELGPLLENHPLFPQRTSVIWSRLCEDGIAIRIWERGAGETQGCGTGATAAAVVHMRHHQVGGPIQVHNPGGVVTITGNSWNQSLSLRSKATVIYQGILQVGG